MSDIDSSTAAYALAIVATGLLIWNLSQTRQLNEYHDENRRLHVKLQEALYD